MTVYYLSFGFDININELNTQNKTRDYPLIILPIFELNVDGNIYRFNIPSNFISKINELNEKEENKINNLAKKENKDLINNYNGDNELDNFILNTQSVTIFVNYHYLKVFKKIFENLWNRSESLRKYLIKKNKSQNNDIITQNEKYIDYKNNSSFLKRRHQKINSFIELKPKKLFNNIENEDKKKENDKKSKLLIKMISTIFDIKIIYLINYKEKYDSTFSYHPHIKKQGYFGYIIRIYSGICKYNNFDDFEKNMTHGNLEVSINLLTVTSLNKNNLNDQNYFLYDKDILNLSKNYKDYKVFNAFMELPYTKINKYKALNNILFNKTGNQQIFEFNLPANIEYYKELPFDFNETLIYFINNKKN